MTQKEYQKKIENLKSWKQFALSGKVPNVDESYKIDQEIIELQRSFDRQEKRSFR